MNQPIRYVLFASYGNDSCALIQWAREWHLEDVAVVYSDTGWSTADWRARVEKMEEWVKWHGFTPYRTKSIGFADLAREKKGFPTQQYQWCSWRLKIEPGRRWLADHDPGRFAIVLVGARREESKSKDDSRATFPEYMIRSENHGGRFMVAPFARSTAEERDAYLIRAGIETLPHRSRECKCINSNRSDMRQYTDDDIAEIRALETEIGRPMYRPHRHMGAKGIDEVRKWARSERGQYEPSEEPAAACDLAWCQK